MSNESLPLPVHISTHATTKGMTTNGMTGDILGQCFRCYVRIFGCSLFDREQETVLESCQWWEI